MSLTPDEREELASIYEDMNTRETNLVVWAALCHTTTGRNFSIDMTFGRFGRALELLKKAFL